MDENLLETNSIYNNNNNAKINNTTTSMNNNTLLNANINKNNTKLIEFIHDLKEAIQNGEFQTNNNNNYSNNQHYLHHQQHQQQEQQQQYETINHVNNLSNQTFNYIINWLKQQQFQIDENKDTSHNRESTSDFKLDNSISSSHVSIEIRMLKNQLRSKDDEKEKLFSKFKQLQEENIDLKTKLFNLKTTLPTSSSGGNTSSSHKCDKDCELDRLKQIVENLLKANDDKDKRIDDLTKQVQRFKRIQDLVFTAQSSGGGGGAIKTKVDFDLNDANSDTNSLPSVHNDEIKFNQKSILINSATKSAAVMESNKQINTTTTTTTSDTAKMSNSLVIASSVNQACNLISSCSLSSSLSSSTSSSSSSASSSASTSPSLLAQSNVNSNLTAPLATISELINYSVNTNSPNNDHKQTNANSTSNKLDHYNTLPNSKRLNQLNDLAEQRTQTLGKLNSKSCISSTTSSATIVNEEKASDDLDASLNATSQWIQKATLKLSKHNKKGSFSSLNDSNENTDTLSKKQTKCASPSHSSNKGLRNFFGKLIRTSLVNINESNFIAQEATKQANDESTTKSLANNNKNLFRRGGTRATANARLQNSFSISNNSLLVGSSTSSANDKVASSFFSFNLDTLAFSKLNATQCYDWLCINGFDCYFAKNADGTYQNRWLKNGLHLLKASKYEYEKELGIKNPLHRKKLSILLQSMYDKNNINLADINLLSGIDYHWVTKWLDDIGLPQYKDVFNEAKIDGLMLNILSTDDLLALNINSELHYLSIKRGIHVLQINNFDTHCLRRRPSGDEQLDKAEVALWTNHRVMEWLRSIDLSEYAPNLRGSGVHGALMVYEARFNSTVLADILAIPTSKTLLRRHLSTLFCDLVGPHVNQIKLDAEMHSSYQPLSASNKLKQSKRLINVSSIFSHKRTKSQDSREFFNGSVSLLSANDDELSTKTKMLMKNYKALTESKKLNAQSATLPMNSVVTFCDSNGVIHTSKKKESRNAKLSMMSQETVPSSIV